MSVEVLFKTYDGRVVVRNYLRERTGKKLTAGQIAAALEFQGFEVDPRTVAAILREIGIEPEETGPSSRKRYTWPDGIEINVEAK